MKSLSLFSAAAFALAAFTSAANAQVTVNITGSTAFRSAVHNSILDAMTGEQYAYTGGTLAGAGQAIFVGNISGVTGTVTIRTGWSGSATGIDAVANQKDVAFLGTGVTMSPGGTSNTPTGASTAKAQFALSDCDQGSTSFTNPALEDAKVAVVPFRFLVNKSTITGNFNNMTPQQFRALYGSGQLPLSFFTGNPADTKFVYGAGRDSGSGTRVITLAETGYGIFVILNQWTGTPAGGALTTLSFAGDGGFSSGGNLATLLSATTTSVSVAGAPAAEILITGYAGIPDSDVAITGGAKALKWNGHDYSVANVQNGQYTFWSYEHMFGKLGLTTAEIAVRDAIIAAIPTHLGTAGIALGSMNVQRPSDGGLVGSF